MKIKDMKFRLFIGPAPTYSDLIVNVSRVLLTPFGCVKGSDFIKGLWKLEVDSNIYLGSYDGDLIVINGHKWIKLNDLYEYDHGKTINYESPLGAFKFEPLANVSAQDEFFSHGVVHLAGWVDQTDWTWGVAFGYRLGLDATKECKRSGFILLKIQELETKLSNWKIQTGEDNLRKVLSGDKDLFHQFALPFDDLFFVP